MLTTPAGAAEQLPSAYEANILFHPTSTNGAVDAIEVVIELTGGPTDGAAFSAPVVYPGAPGVAERIKNLVVTDAKGEVALAVSEDPAQPGGFPYLRHWKAQRSVTYPVKIGYRALIQPAGGPKGPAFAIRAVGGGVAGSGAGFLLLPDDEGIARTNIRWDLSALPTGSFASTSFGDGDFTQNGSPLQLLNSWLVAGPAGRYPQQGSVNGFASAWLGKPTYDVNAAARFSADGYHYLASYFPHLRPSPQYRVYFQFRDAEPYGGGTALTQSFMLSQGPVKPGETPEAPRTTIFHEMIHQWVGMIDAPMGVSSWFSEG
ncbi:MAG: hypothetical protein QM605_00005, partial [Sphingobium sp.]